MSATLIVMDKKSVLIGCAVVFGIGAGLGTRLFLRREAPPAAVETAPATAVSATPPAAPAPPLPTMEEGEALLRARAAALSSDARWADWLKTEDLLRHAAAIIANLAADRNPREAFAFLAPRKKFPLKRVDGAVFADPAGYARYDHVAEVVSGIDAAAAARLLKELGPLFSQACREFGGSSCDYPDAFVRAAGHLLQTPVAEQSPRLKPAEKGIVFAFADESLERLSAAQKQLLRMGPKNQLRIQAELRRIVLALGVPESQIPKAAR